MTWLMVAAREQGKYEALGGHRARGSMRSCRKCYHTLCGVCHRHLNWNEDQHF